MNNKNWFKVWNNKKIDNLGKDSFLAKLIKANGFDSGAGDYKEEEWIKLCKDFGEIIGINKNQKVLELGCGSGAFLFCLKQIYQCKIFGIDYSKPLIEIAKKNLSGVFLLSEANELNKMKESFDLIYLHSVTQYFPSLEYTINVIEKSFKKLKLNGKLALLDVNDKSKEDFYHLNRRSKYKNPEEYDLLYSNHPHLFFDKNEISSILKRVGFKNIFFYPHKVKSYGNSKFRFNIVAQKNEIL